MDVFTVKPKGFNVSSFQDFLSAQDGSSLYVSNGGASNIIQSRIPDRKEYFFEVFPGKLIFLHQDKILSGLNFVENILKIIAWKNIASRSFHLCIEPNDLVDLKSVGIFNAAIVPHATEIEPSDPCENFFDYNVSFVGHVVPSSYRSLFDEKRIQDFIDRALEIKCGDFAASLHDHVGYFSKSAAEILGDKEDREIIRIAYSQWLRTQLKNQSLQFRGWLLEHADIGRLTIFGGDPAYLHGVDRDIKIDRPGIFYSPATHDLQKTKEIFRQSRININITSLQFDHAVVNRFHDVTMSGGLCLTEPLPGLSELTSAYDDISFRTISDLEDRVKYFSRPENLRQRTALIKMLQKDINQNSGYPMILKFILSAIESLG